MGGLTPMNEREALSFALGVLAGLRDDPRQPNLMREMCGAALALLIPRLRELGIELDERAWAVMEG